MRSTTACRVRGRALALGFALAIVAGIAASPASAETVAPVEAHTPAAAPPTLAALLEGFQTMPGFEARFEEEKTLALLAVPLRSRGRLYFAPPSTLLRRVESPDPHDILIREQVVRIARPRAETTSAPPPSSTAASPKQDTQASASSGAAAVARDVETIDLARRDDVRPLVESMVWIFAGDLAHLESVYRIDYHPVAPAASGRWQLELVPRAEPLSRLVRGLSIAGRGHAAETLVVTEASGDRTTTRILEANAARRFAAGELEALFGTGAP
jgi:hypothetical protein